MAAQSPSRPFELALLALLALFWGSSYLFIKVALETIPPLTLIAFRVSFAALLLYGVARWQGHRFPADLSTWMQFGIQCLFLCIGGWAVLAWGQQFIDSGLAGILNSTSPIFVFLITFLWTRHESVGGLRLAGALTGLAGVILIIGADALRGLGTQVTGQIAVLASAVLYGASAIYGKRFSHLPPTITAAGTMTVAATLLVPASLLVEHPWALRPSAVSISAAVALSVISSCLALLLYFRLIKTLGSMGTASQAYLRVGVSVMLGAVILGEGIGWTVAVGLIAVVAGVVAINVRPAAAK